MNLHIIKYIVINCQIHSYVFNDMCVYILFEIKLRYSFLASYLSLVIYELDRYIFFGSMDIENMIILPFIDDNSYIIPS